MHNQRTAQQAPSSLPEDRFPRKEAIHLVEWPYVVYRMPRKR